MKILTDLLNRIRYRAGRRISASTLTDEFTYIEIIENALKADGVLHWRVIRFSAWLPDERTGAVETGTLTDLRSRITKLRDAPT